MDYPSGQVSGATGGREKDHTTNYYTVVQVAKRYGVSNRVVYEALVAGAMKGFKLGGWLVSDDALSAFEAAGGFRRERTGAAPPRGQSNRSRQRKRPIVTKILL